MNIELVGLPCAGKTTMVKKILADSDIFRRARLRDKLLNLMLNPQLTLPFTKLVLQMCKRKVPLAKALIRSIHLMPLRECQNLISDEGVIVYSSAVGMDPTNTDFTYLDNYNTALYIFLEPSEVVLRQQMSQRGRLNIDYNPSETDYKVSFNKRVDCFENWKRYLEKNDFKYLSLPIIKLRSLMRKLQSTE